MAGSRCQSVALALALILASTISGCGGGVEQGAAPDTAGAQSVPDRATTSEAAAGAVGGTAVAAASEGNQVVAASRSTLQFQLASPLTLTILQSVTSTQ